MKKILGANKNCCSGRRSSAVLYLVETRSLEAYASQPLLLAAWGQRWRQHGASADEVKVKLGKILQGAEAMASDTLSVVADRGYFKSEQILTCHNAGITAYVPKPMTSGAKADGRFNNDGFVYDAAKNEYIRNLPGAGQHLAPRLLAAFGEQRERFHGAEELQKYSGIAPVTKRSGKKSWVHWR
jgi:hypothetical protein